MRGRPKVKKPLEQWARRLYKEGELIRTIIKRSLGAFSLYAQDRRLKCALSCSAKSIELQCGRDNANLGAGRVDRVMLHGDTVRAQAEVKASSNIGRTVGLSLVTVIWFVVGTISAQAERGVGARAS